MTGRPPLLETNPERVTAFLDLVRGGISPSNAVAEIEGLAWSSVMKWQKLGREAAAIEAEGGRELTEREILYRDFADKLQRARKRRILRNEQMLAEQLRGDDVSVRDRLAVLARLDPENWAEPEKRVRFQGEIETTNANDDGGLSKRIEEYEAAFAATFPRDDERDQEE